MKHPRAQELALHASGDLALWRGFVVRCHLLGCEQCRRDVDAHVKARRDLNAAVTELPAGLEWNRLAAEMHANIRLGLEAGECVAGPPVLALPRRDWRAAMALAAAVVVAVGAWWLNGPGPARHALEADLNESDVVLEATAAGVEIKQAGGAFALTHRGSEAVTVTVSVGGAARAGYIDDDTGQVTITHVSLD